MSTNQTMNGQENVLSAGDPGSGSANTFDANSQPQDLNQGQGIFTSSITAWPNPTMGGEVNVLVTVNMPGQASVNIYDRYGKRIVATQDEGYISSKEFTYTWDGKVNYGDQAKPGLYFIEVIIGNQVETVRIIRQ